MGERETEQLGYLVLELVVRAEHGLGAESRVRNDTMDMQKELWEPASEIRQEALRHRPQ